ncbi:sarcosine oxidase subunit gamma [Epibacterium ulvae]|uniref:Sarcosine oxidase subunit gamma n=1 Tax=Epibacterium ulvae TaxID=1156985 RepID=A0A1G5QFY4_9RHOB|nr:sarcosine oxidase subunit gamma [Epibacterium ulvae]SCZ60704.1 sarcosine oxidase subunit gamma [Epibacterium ulvae]
MTDLISITALGSSTPCHHTFGAYRLRENSGLALASFAVAQGDVVPAPFGLDLPEAGGFSTQGAYAAFWTGPNQWMIEGAGLAETDFAQALRAETAEARVTEQTDGWVAFDILVEEGAQMAPLLARIVNLPQSALAPGGAVRTGFDHMSVFVIRRSDTHLSVIGMRSLAATLWHALETVIKRLET